MTRTRWWLRWPLAAATAWLGVVYEWSDYRRFDLPTLAGRVEMFVSDGGLRLRTPPDWWASDTPTATWAFSFARAGSSWRLKIPLIALVVPTGGAALWAWWPRRTPPGRCRKFGYDMAGLDAGAVCPECGALPVVHKE